MIASDDGFLVRWSRRKRGAAVPEEPAPEAVVVPEAPDDEPAALPAAPAAEVPLPAPDREIAAEPVSLPSLDSVTLDGNLSAFLRPGVPSGLRHAALRRMWSLDVGIRDFVGPADYAWDYNVEGGVPGSSLKMVGNLRAMLAQIVGRTEAQLDVDEAVLRGEAPPEVMPPAAEPALPEDLAEPLPVAAVSAPAFVPPAIAAAAWPGSNAAPIAFIEAPPRGLPPARKRHGAAIPA